MTDKQFQIDQLRKDKIIYATESTAFNLFCLLAFLSADYIEIHFISFFDGWIKPMALMSALAYTLFMGVGNFMRLKLINKLTEEKI